MANELAGNPGVNQEVNNEPETKETTKPASPMDFLKTHKEKLKVNGKDRELSYDDLKRYASMGLASDEKFAGAKKMNEEAKAIQSAFESGDVVGALSKLGKNKAEIKELLENHLLNMLEEETLDPKDRELRDLKKEKAEREAKEKEAAELRQKEINEKNLEKARQRLEGELVGAIESSNLPRTAAIFKKVAAEMEAAYTNDYNMTAEEAVKIVEQELIEEYAALLPKLGADRVKKALGADMLKAIQEEQVRAIKESAPQQYAKRNENKPQKTETDNKHSNDRKIGLSEHYRNLRRGIRD